jgi:mRNA interferase HigB
VLSSIDFSEPPMHVISRKKLVAFWKKYPDAMKALATWFKAAEQARWAKWADVIAAFPKASYCHCCLIFNICGGSYHLVVRRATNWNTLFVVGVYTHSDYDRDHWKAFCARR